MNSDKEKDENFLVLYEPHEGRWLEVPTKFVHDYDADDETKGSEDSKM